MNNSLPRLADVPTMERVLASSSSTLLSTRTETAIDSTVVSQHTDLGVHGGFGVKVTITTLLFLPNDILRALR